jgi:hypothetical protein
MRDFVRGALEIGRSYWRIAVLLPGAGRGLLAGALCVNVLLGLLPLVFIVATSVMIGRVPAAVSAGVGSAEWRSRSWRRCRSPWASSPPAGSTAA